MEVKPKKHKKRQKGDGFERVLIEKGTGLTEKGFGGKKRRVEKGSKHRSINGGNTPTVG